VTPPAVTRRPGGSRYVGGGDLLDRGGGVALLADQAPGVQAQRLPGAALLAPAQPVGDGCPGGARVQAKPAPGAVSPGE
jgi:hypothetical protein